MNAGKVKIESTFGRTEIFIDGIKIPRVNSAYVKFEPDGLPTITIECNANDLEIDAEAMALFQEKEGISKDDMLSFLKSMIESSPCTWGLSDPSELSVAAVRICQKTAMKG